MPQCDIGIRAGRIAGLGKAGNPDVMDGVTDGMVVRGVCVCVCARARARVVDGVADGVGACARFFNHKIAAIRP